MSIFHESGVFNDAYVRLNVNVVFVREIHREMDADDESFDY